MRTKRMDKILTPSISQLLHNKAHYLKAFLIWLEAVFFMLMVRRLYLFQFSSRHNWRQLFSFFFAISSLSCVQLGWLGHGFISFRDFRSLSEFKIQIILKNVSIFTDFHYTIQSTMPKKTRFDFRIKSFE